MTQWGLDTLFNPSKRHMDEEKRRLQATREEVGDNSGGERIDVSTGKVVIKVADAGEESPEPEAAESSASDRGRQQHPGRPGPIAAGRVAPQGRRRRLSARAQASGSGCQPPPCER